MMEKTQSKKIWTCTCIRTLNLSYMGVSINYMCLINSWTPPPKRKMRVTVFWISDQKTGYLHSMLSSIIPGVGKTEDQVSTISINIVIVIQDCFPVLNFAWNFELCMAKNICFIFWRFVVWHFWSLLLAANSNCLKLLVALKFKLTRIK